MNFLAILNEQHIMISHVIN